MWLLRTVFLFILFCISACNARIEFLPDGENLKPAKVGEPYYLKINILGGGVIGGPKKIAGLAIPNNNGIFLRHCQLPEWEVVNMQPKDSNNYNCVEIYGTPIKNGDIKIIISGSMYGSMISSAREFSKNYKLQVVQP